MENKNLLSIFLILSIVLLGFFLYFNLINNFCILEKKEIYAQVIISDRYGIDVNGSALMFGMIPPGNSASREIILKNDYNKDVKLKIYIKGNLSDFMSVSENNFLLKEGENKTIIFSVYPRGDISEGVYIGFVELVFSKA